MKLRDEGGLIEIVAESQHERAGLALLAARLTGRSLRLAGYVDGSVLLEPADPINITFDTTPMPLRLISNLAETPFVLDQRRYASIEGFWQGLKFPAETDRQRVAALSGHAAKKAGPSSKPGDWFRYQGKDICVGTVDHWALMERACVAKFEQHEGARAALLATTGRPLEHKVQPDSRTIPGIVMADIWTRIRAGSSQ